jgi:hypothetical protein
VYRIVAKKRPQVGSTDEGSLQKKQAILAEKDTVPATVAQPVPAPVEAKEPSSLFADYDSD